jgi:hypothetical protein
LGVFGDTEHYSSAQAACGERNAPPTAPHPPSTPPTPLLPATRRREYIFRGASPSNKQRALLRGPGVPHSQHAVVAGVVYRTCVGGDLAGSLPRARATRGGWVDATPRARRVVETSTTHTALHSRGFATRDRSLTATYDGAHRSPAAMDPDGSDLRRSVRERRATTVGWTTRRCVVGAGKHPVPGYCSGG